MIKKKKTGGRDFKPGNPGGPGRPKLDPEIKGMREMPKDVFKKTITFFMEMNLAQLEEYLKDIKDKPVFDVYIAATIAEGMKKKDHTIFEWLAQRSVGKVRDEIDHNVTNNIHQDLLNYIKERQTLEE